MYIILTFFNFKFVKLYIFIWVFKSCWQNPNTAWLQRYSLIKTVSNRFVRSFKSLECPSNNKLNIIFIPEQWVCPKGAARGKWVMQDAFIRNNMMQCQRQPTDRASVWVHVNLVTPVWAPNRPQEHVLSSGTQLRPKCRRFTIFHTKPGVSSDRCDLSTALVYLSKPSSTCNTTKKALSSKLQGSSLRV